MGKCPFCKGEVQEDLLRFGGPCPHCFNTIPGEEAATDPGAKLRAAEAAAEKKKERKRSAVNGAVAAVVLLLAVGGGLAYRYQKQKEQELLTIQFDTTFDIFTADPSEWANIYAEVEQVADAGPAPTNSGSKAKNPGNPRPRKVEDVETPDRLATEEGPAGDARSASMGPGSLSTGTIGLSAGPGTSLSSADIVLKDQGQIERMIKAVMVQNRGQLTACYEETLKAKPNFGGMYTLYFTVNPDGTTSKVSVEGSGVSDPGFEQCVTNKIKSWKFTKVNVARPIEFPYKLRSTG